MLKYLLSLLLLATTLFCNAQNRASVKGKLVDSLNQSPIEFATVAIVNMKDTTSSLVSYTLSDKTGSFALHNLPAGIPLKVLITFIAYKPFRKVITFQKAENIDLGTILLNPKQLKEVSVTGERVPIVIKGDTVEFNAEAFKTRPNAVVEELLKKLPGIEIANDGTITVNGKNVSKIMIDGREFFANDPKIASKNLDADLIAKVQVYDDRENDPDHLIEDSKVSKIINLKFKKALKISEFGKVYAGGGTRSRFETGGLFNMFRDTLQISVIGVGNNLSRTGFSREELSSQGGFNRSGNDALYNGSTSFGGTNYSGTQNVATGGFNINTDYGKKLKINLLYFFSHTQNNNSNKTSSERFLYDTTAAKRDTTIFSSSEYGSTRTDNKHNISGLVRWAPNEATQIRYTPALTFTGNNNLNNSASNSYSNFLPRINQGTFTGWGSGNNVQFQQTFSYFKRLKKKGASVTINHNLTLNPGTSNSFSNNDIISYSATVPTSLLNRLTSNDNHSTDIGASIGLRSPVWIKKLTGDITLSTNYTNRGGTNYIYNFDPAANNYDVYLDTLSTNLNRTTFTESIQPGLTYAFTKRISLILKLTAQLTQIDNQFNKGLPNLYQNYLNLLPNARLTIYDVTLSYDARVSQPGINDLLPVRFVTSPYYSFNGNINLKPTWRNNFNASYYKYIPASQININVYGSATIEESTVFRQRTENSQGVTTTTPVNRDGQHSFNLSFSFNKGFKKINNWKFGTSFSTYLYNNHSFFQINRDQGYQDTRYLSFSPRVTINWNDKLEIDPSYSAQLNSTVYTGVKYNNVNTLSHNLDVNYSFHLPQKTDLEGNYTYSFNPLVSAGFQKSVNLLNVSLAHQFLKKDRGQIKLSCYDILDQNISSYRYAYGNTVSDTQSQILKRYFLLTLQFKFNKAITK